jgi:hypothetical protein
MSKSRMKIPPEFEPWMPEKARRLLWKEYGRNDKERLKKHNAELKREAEKRRERAEQKRRYGQKHRDDIKHEALEHYSLNGVIKCSRCKFNDIRALGLHGENRDAPASVHGGSNLYEWLKAHGWPEGFRVLCMNHQFIEAGRGSLYPLKIEVFSRYCPWPDDQIKYRCPKCRHAIFIPSMVKCPKCHEPLLHQIKCVRCGFDDMRALSLDHVEGGGREHMRQLGINPDIGKASDWYQRLKDRHYPQKPKLQVLCMNCQTIKEHETLEWS